MLVCSSVKMFKAAPTLYCLEEFRCSPISSFLAAGPGWRTEQAPGQAQERSASEHSRWQTVPPGGTTGLHRYMPTHTLVWEKVADSAI